ncbi:IS110 family transposase [Actinoplanes xinjiangensis]|uniref:IS110 family transposase n=1 Tax=Actinoplanes xinjiangensis TaxID=512350 RepID=UPI00341665B8
MHRCFQHASPRLEVTEATAELVERIAALDIGKAVLAACIRILREKVAGRRRQGVAEYSTSTAALLRVADLMRERGVTRVAMEATSDYWKPVFYLLEAEGFECWLLNATHVTNVPGRPETDKLDAVWFGQGRRAECARPASSHRNRSAAT